MNCTLAALALSIASLATASFGQNVEPILSKECGKFSAAVEPAEKNGKGGQTATVEFEDFHIKLSKSKANKSRDCNATVNVTIPAGQQLKFISATAEGAVDLYKKSKAELSLKAEIELIDEVFSDKAKLKKSGDLKVAARIDEPRFTECSDEEQVMSIDLHLRAYLKHRGKGTSVLELDDASAGHKFVCNWQWQKCEDQEDDSGPFQKPMTTYYQFPGERAYKAMVKISGDEGSYAVDAKGIEGTLSDIEYSDDGMHIEGRWSEEGKEGWFSWTMINADTGRFTGNFGYDDKHLHEGEWWGYYTEDDADDR